MSPHRASAAFTDRWEHFRFQVADGVGTVTFDRPDRLNALTFETYSDLRDLLTELTLRDDVSVLILTGEGRGFCSGGDVNDIIGALQETSSKGLLEFTRMTGAVVQGMREFPRPIIAAINGVAAGAGAVIALAADLRLMADTATIQFLFTKVGLAGADMGAAYLLPRMVGLARASQLLLLGEAVTPDAAVGMGLAIKHVPAADLLAEANALALNLARGPSWAVGTTKSLLVREQDMSMEAAIELEAWAQALLMTSDDHREFYRAFTEGRPPQWRGQ
jgi:enoyl-CoA hydratase/carnithine racemase